MEMLVNSRSGRSENVKKDERKKETKDKTLSATSYKYR